jgi:type I restriction enzyme S subunit
MATPAVLADAPALLIDQFDRLMALPGGVKRLRELILQLAVQGKLVPQDPTDEPASALLKQIEAEKERLVREGKIKPPNRLPPVSEDEVPFALPSGWEWVRLGHCTHDLGQKIPETTFSYIDVSCIDKERGVISSDVQIIESSDAPSRARKLVSQGTVIYSTVRPYLLNIAIVDRPFDPEPIASTAFAILNPYIGLNN